MHSYRWLRMFKFLVIATIIVAILGWLVVGLWNWLVPSIFGGHAITFWQGVGLFVLARILVGGFGGHHRHRGWKHRMHGRWHEMTPEQREKFRAGMHGRCHFGAARWQGTPPQESSKTGESAP